MSKIEVLVSTMENKSIDSLYKSMELKSDVLIINQSDELNYEEKIMNDKKIRQYSFNERGVGISRNSALMRSVSDICIMSDDDMIYNSNYEETIKKAYKKYPDADVILFNVNVLNNEEISRTVNKNGIVRKINCLKYGTVNITFKRNNVLERNVFFSLLFGGGAKYGSGEDSIFLWEVLSKGLKVYSVKDTIAISDNTESSWFKGYNEKYFYDKGALFGALSNRFGKLLIIQFVIRHKEMYKSRFTSKDVLKIMIRGFNDYVR